MIPCNEPGEPLSRRRLLALTASALALPGALQFFGAWLEAAPRQHQAHWQPPESAVLRDYQPKFFAAADFAALQALTAILIPTDDTPGASEARCAHFIDFLLHASEASAPDVAAEWRAGMRTLETIGFHAGDPARQAALVEAMSRPERVAGATDVAYRVYRLVKQQNTFAFYTSRAGMIETLDYKGNSYNVTFPACDHPEHRVL
jgi:hypothetical protein